VTHLLSRRLLIQSVTAACLANLGATAGLAQKLRPVRLVVVRRPPQIPSSSCTARCIRGRIYDVSDMGDQALDTTILPLLSLRQAVCDTIERPWANNQPNVSSIPAGVYGAQVRSDATKQWMTTLDRRWRLELVGVPHRSAIQFHYGQDEAWSQGCLILGQLLSDSGNVGEAAYCQLTNGEAAVAALRGAVASAGADQTAITVGVCDDAGLFPNFHPSAPCG
jgi:Family of unknown function (DUF5675)